MLRKKKNVFADKEIEDYKDGDSGPVKKPTCPAEIRLRTEFSEIDLPAHAKLDFPDPSN